jgi:hypothetical protein
LSAPGASDEQSEKDRDFEKLVSDLRGALEVKGGPGKVWLTEKERKDFRIMLVDKVCCVGGKRARYLTCSIFDYQLERLLLRQPITPMTNLPLRTLLYLL